MKPFIGKCKFNNCQHIHEPQCAVLEALEAEQIPTERYQSYLSIMANEDVFN
jgi:ribosome biogenesis GTPase